MHINKRNFSVFTEIFILIVNLLMSTFYFVYLCIFHGIFFYVHMQCVAIQLLILTLKLKSVSNVCSLRWELFFYVSDSVLLTAHFLCDVSTSLFVALPHFFYIVASLQRLSDSSFAHLYIQEALQRLIKFAIFSFHFLMEGIEPPDVSPI